MANKTNGLESEWVRGPPPTGPFWERVAKTIFNPEDNSILGRTPKRWGIVFTFYLVFYAVLAVMFAACMGGLFYSIDRDKPTYILGQSLIGVNPGVAHRPRATDGAVINYAIENKTDYEHYIHSLEELFLPYKMANQYLDHPECGPDSNYGFPETPCFFIKLNKIYGWEPEYLDVSALPEDMSDELADHIRNNTEKKQVWVSCWDEHDNETVIEYPWGMGLTGTAYPYENTLGHLSPLVAIKVTPPVNRLVAIRCRAWAKNIIYNKSLKEPSGYTRIQLNIEGKVAASESTVAE